MFVRTRAIRVQKKGKNQRVTWAVWQSNCMDMIHIRARDPLHAVKRKRKRRIGVLQLRIRFPISFKSSMKETRLSDRSSS